MTNQQHPITPPPELVREWIKNSTPNEPMFAEVATQAARWGADQELEACVEWAINTRAYDMTPGSLRAARRPKPPSLKEQALDAWIRLRNEASCEKVDGDLDCLLRALESLPD